jgi:hypothetical protein
LAKESSQRKTCEIGPEKKAFMFPVAQSGAGNPRINHLDGNYQVF